MSGIVFFETTIRDRLVSFYRERLGATRWLEQEAGCTILAIDNLLLGFCDSTKPETDGVLTVVLDDRAAVDRWYERLEDIAAEPPTHNPEFDIYQFFASDPEGRTLEVQTFEHATQSVSNEE